MPESLRLDDPRVMDSTAALDRPEVPRSRLVAGGGYIGLELGTVYAALGSAVTVVEMTDGLLPGADRDLVDILARQAGQTMSAVRLKTRVVRMSPEASGIRRARARWPVPCGAANHDGVAVLPQASAVSCA